MPDSRRAMPLNSFSSTPEPLIQINGLWRQEAPSDKEGRCHQQEGSLDQMDRCGVGFGFCVVGSGDAACSAVCAN
jgi:hypothetical protein